MNNKFFAQAEAFVAVVRYHSITDAAHDLRTTKSNISQKLSELEAHLGVTLINRTTRKMALTPAGHKVYRTCVEAVDQTAKAAFDVGAVMAGDGQKPSGRVRFSGSNAYLTHVVLPLMGRFMAQYPDIEVVFHGSDRKVDFLAEDVDLGVRIGAGVDDTYLATLLKPLKRILCVSPALMGAINEPADLQEIPNVLREQENPVWEMRRGKDVWNHSVSASRLVVNTIELCQQAVKGGLGVALISQVVVQDDLDARRMVRVLPQWNFDEIPVVLLSRQSRIASPPVRVLRRYLMGELGVAEL